jgi:hypothetical protein
MAVQQALHLFSADMPQLPDTPAYALAVSKIQT